MTRKRLGYQVAWTTILAVAMAGLLASCSDDDGDEAAATPATGPFALTFGGDGTFGVAHAGQNMHVAVVRVLDSMTVSTLSPIVLPPFLFSFGAILQAGLDYNVDYYVDVNTSGTCDPPPTDHAWRYPISNVTTAVTQTETHTLNFVNVCGTTFPP